jgi:ribose transport system substrate-binding protein
MRLSRKGEGMRKKAKLLRRPSRRSVLVGGTVGVVLAAIVGTAIAASGPKPTGPANVTIGTKCGQSRPVGPKNRNSVVFRKMSKQLQDVYHSYPDNIVASPWTTTKIKAKPPWKIGYITIGVSNPYQNNVLTQLKKEFALAKAKGLVKGQLMTYIPPSLSASTGEGQISAIKQMISQGANAIIINPVDSVGEAPTMEESGKKFNVPIILADVPPVPGTKWTVSPWTQNQVEADAGTLGIINKKGGGDIIIVRGIPGNQNDVVLYNQKVADLKNCPNIKVATTLYGQWDGGTAKTVVSQYLAANPSKKIAGVLNDGGMAAGIIQAFESRGVSVPPVAMEQCYAGDLSWWLDKIDSYETVAGCINGFQGGYVYFNTALRVLSNKGPKYNILSMPAVAIDTTNLKFYARPNVPITSSDELPGPKTAWCDDKCLDKYFLKPGPAKK